MNSLKDVGPHSAPLKLCLISNILPPSESGHAAIIHRLLRGLDPNDYCLLSSTDYVTGDHPNYSGRLPGKYYHLPTPFQLTRGTRLGLHHPRRWINLTLAVISRARAIARIIRREGCAAVVVCTGGREVLDMPAGYLASLVTRARFYPYLLDQYSHMVSFVMDNYLLRRLEPLMMKGAAAVIAPNEFLRDELRRRYKIEAEVIHNPCDLSEYEGAAGGGCAGGGGEVKIVYTGCTGVFQNAPLRNLAAALELLGREDLRLHLYTMSPEESLRNEGLRGPVVYHGHKALADMPAIQQGADILFLPLAFESPYPEIVRTAAPSKLGEYLAARRPVLVNAPPDSFVTWYFRRHECGLVVDEPHPARLASAVELLLNDADLRKRLTARAWERAEADFSITGARKKFRELLSP